VDELQKYNPELRKLSVWLRAVKAKHGFFPIVQLQNKGLIKKHVVKKGQLRAGVIQGKESYYVLTAKGKKMLTALTQLGY